MQADAFYAPVSPAKVERGGEGTLTNSERKAQERSYKELMMLANRLLSASNAPAPAPRALIQIRITPPP